VTLFLLNQIGQEGVDRMIYWTLAIPFGVWVIWLIWGLIKMPHKVYKSDITAVISGADVVNDRKTGFGNFARFFLISLVVGTFVSLSVLKNKQISELQAQLKLPKQTEHPKLLPDKTIANPTNPVPAQAIASA